MRALRGWPLHRWGEAPLPEGSRWATGVVSNTGSFTAPPWTTARPSAALGAAASHSGRETGPPSATPRINNPQASAESAQHRVPARRISTRPRRKCLADFAEEETERENE
ncbi:hypothetical protein AAFF_G00146460 [Aldrovandia affinis]|uniref:Uncharacterized protein n=1 Tax=Aldrovandia affinis TaxID=143900 RepID=A0AAD7W9A2_9TELE|nr:hypothetical protein AAFF_G00146460 [Aldrovandia affinis]